MQQSTKPKLKKFADDIELVLRDGLRGVRGAIRTRAAHPILETERRHRTPFHRSEIKRIAQGAAISVDGALSAAEEAARAMLPMRGPDDFAPRGFSYYFAEPAGERAFRKDLFAALKLLQTQPVHETPLSAIYWAIRDQAAREPGADIVEYAARSSAQTALSLMKLPTQQAFDDQQATALTIALVLGIATLPRDGFVSGRDMMEAARLAVTARSQSLAAIIASDDPSNALAAEFKRILPHLV